ncbi:MAG: hypothetical protein KA100_05650 [Rickettsiales bacterium]|nr:hypothetical protein [Rickettsiales bacterium]
MPNACIAVLYGAPSTNKTTICNTLKTDWPEVEILSLDLAGTRHSESLTPDFCGTLDRAISNSSQGKPTILKIEAALPNIEKVLTDYLQSKHHNCPTFVAATYLPLEENIRRIEAHNEKSENQQNIWRSICAIGGAFADPATPKTSDKYLETLQRSQMFNLAYNFIPEGPDYSEEVGKLFHLFGFAQGQEQVRLHSATPFYQTLTPQQTQEATANIARNMRKAQLKFNVENEVPSSSFFTTIFSSFLEQKAVASKGGKS